MVHRICQKHQDERTGLNSVKKHIAEQNEQQKKKRMAAEEHVEKPPLKKISEEKGIDDHRMIPVNTENKPIDQHIIEEKI